MQTNAVSTRNATTGNVCQKHGKHWKCQQRLTQDETLRNISGTKSGPTAHYFCARNDGLQNRASYVSSKLCVTANQSHYSRSIHFYLLSIVAKKSIIFYNPPYPGKQTRKVRYVYYTALMLCTLYVRT